MFATLENDQYLHQSILSQVSHGILVLIQVEFFMEGASEGYVTQTRSEINGILASLRTQ